MYVFNACTLDRDVVVRWGEKMEFQVGEREREKYIIHHWKKLLVMMMKQFGV